MNPRVGMVIGAAIASLIVLAVLGIVFALLPVERRRQLRDKMRENGSRSAWPVGLVAGLLSLGGIAVYAPPKSRPVLVFTAYWLLGVALPVAMGIWIFARLARRHHAREWVDLVEGTRTLGELPGRFQLGFVLTLFLSLVPGAIVAAYLL